MKDKELAKLKSIDSYLASQGYRPIKKRSTGRYNVYLSILRSESEPSFFVDKNRNLWRDFGYGDEGWKDIIELVMQHEAKSFPEAINSLLSRTFIKKLDYVEVYKPGIEIVDLRPLTDGYLLNYIRERLVDVDLARIYCQQAYVRFPTGKDSSKEHLYIAFKNDKGGYELRNHYSVDIKKVSTSPKYFTRFNGDPEKYNLFEGFFNFLALLTRYKKDHLKNTTVVLNSLVNLVYLYETLKKCTENNIFLDNDEPADKFLFKGDPKLKIVSLKEQGIPYTDRRDIFGGANDYNDFIQGKLII